MRRQEGAGYIRKRHTASRPSNIMYVHVCVYELRHQGVKTSDWMSDRSWLSYTHPHVCKC